MRTRRIKIVLLHTWYHFLHSMETWVDVFWNPAVQIWVYALIALSFKQTDSPQGLFVMIGMIFWNAIWVGEYAIAVGALWEIWAQSFSGLFISPLSMTEFIVGQMISGTIKSLLAIIVSAVIAFVLYNFSLLSIGWMNVIYILELLVFSWAVGILSLSLIFRYSTQVQSLSWALVFLIQPFGAVFYPVSVLPVQIRWISYGLPATYIFETIRKQITTGIIDWQALGIATILNGVWFILACLIFQYTFRQAKKSGAFARLEG